MFDKLKKRRCYPVPGLDGVFIRLLNGAEQSRLRKIAVEHPELINDFARAVMLVREDGAAEFPQTEGETDADYAARFATEAAGFDAESEKAMEEAYGKLSKASAVPVEDIAKN